MKLLFSILFIILSFEVMAQKCGPKKFKVWSETSGYSCVSRLQTDESDCVMCDATCGAPASFEEVFASFPTAVLSKKDQPWWATQGELFFPNLHYPGAWKKNGVNASYYPGEGAVHALKPNIYVNSIHDDKKFSFSFLGKDPQFLATTPALDTENTWKGKIVNKDRFEVDGVLYDYLFYDIRLPQDKMQFERGLCTSREEAIKWMLNDLKEMKYPTIAQGDFEETWKVKIPDYPFYCIYPQYNDLLNEAVPVSIILDQVRITRSLYVLVPYQSEPNYQEPHDIPLPTMDPSEIRPSSLITYENMFKEWGVAFLGE